MGKSITSNTQKKDNQTPNLMLRSMQGDEILTENIDYGSISLRRTKKTSQASLLMYLE
jgi:hypothetical protein